MNSLIPQRTLGPEKSFPENWARRYFESLCLSHYEYRHYYDQFTSSIPGWSDWTRIDLRDTHKLQEITDYIRRGYRYEIRPVYAERSFGYEPIPEFVAEEQRRYDQMSNAERQAINWSDHVRRTPQDQGPEA